MGVKLIYDHLGIFVGGFSVVTIMQYLMYGFKMHAFE